MTPGAPWRVVEVRALRGYRLRVRFVDGTAGEVDLREFLFAPNPGVFRPLQDPDAFAQVGIVGGAVTWPGDLDLAPDAMYDEIVAHGHWNVEPFPAP